MANPLVEAMVQEKRIFDTAHSFAEQTVPVLCMLHRALNRSIDSLALDTPSRSALEIGIRAFEVVSGTEMAAGFTPEELLRYMAEQQGNNFTLNFAEDLERVGRALPAVHPELADASTHLVVAHMGDSSRQIVDRALSGAGIMHDALSQASFAVAFGDDGTPG